MHYGRRALVLSTVALLGVMAGSPSLSASPETHCVVNVVDQAVDGELITGPVRCYATFAEAMYDASNGTLALAEDTTGSDVFAGGVQAVQVASFAIGIHYDGASGTGSSITVSGSGCTGGFWNTGSAWANRISSSWNGCGRLRHWDLPTQGGASENTFGAGTTDNLTSLNNKVESVSYHSS